MLSELHYGWCRVQDRTSSECGFDIEGMIALELAVLAASTIAG